MNESIPPLLGKLQAGFEECEVGDFVLKTGAETSSLVEDGTLLVNMGNHERRYEAKFELNLDPEEGCIWRRVA